MNLNVIKVDSKATLGEKILMLESRTLYQYKDGVRSNQSGITVTCVSETAGFEKFNVKLPDVMELPFEFNGTPTPVEFDDLELGLWQDWNNRGTVQLTATARAIKPTATGRRLQLNA